MSSIDLYTSIDCCDSWNDNLKNQYRSVLYQYQTSNSYYMSFTNYSYYYQSYPGDSGLGVKHSNVLGTYTNFLAPNPNIRLWTMCIRPVTFLNSFYKFTSFLPRVIPQNKCTVPVPFQSIATKKKKRQFNSIAPIHSSLSGPE